ncbi:MAG: hypothetical protein GXY76_05775 [Chloroflexi bacterium]|nr:hypothetical protein [Chloroflexota bacterium]
MSESSQRTQLLKALGNTLLDGSATERERQNAKRALGRMASEPVLTQLALKALSADSEAMLLDVLDVLEQRPTLGETEPALLGFLFDASPQVRQRVLHLLGARGTPRALRTLDSIIETAAGQEAIFTEADLLAAQRARRSIQRRAA